MNIAQKIAWTAFEQHEILFLIGPAGTAKTFLSIAFAISEIKAKKKRKIILTRPLMEAGEKLGYLPGDILSKTDPFFTNIYSSIDKLLGGIEKEKIEKHIEIAPLAYLRGRNFDDAICIFDEAQNATYMQFKLYLTRLGQNSKMIINGDPDQSDLRKEDVALLDVVKRLEQEPGIGIVEFKENSIVRNKLVSRILARLK